MKPRIQFCFVFLLLTVRGLFAQDTKLSPVEILKAEIYKLQDDPDFQHGVWSLCVLDVKKDCVLAEYNSGIGLVPASSLKVVTTGAAIALLGENYRYETKIQYDGLYDSINGILYGNLYIKGSGDPTLGSKYFLKEKDTVSTLWKWTHLLQSKGIRKIEGSVIADPMLFDVNTIPETWIWGDMGNYYGAGAGGLNYRDNLYSVYFQSKNEGDSVQISKIVPAIPHLQLYNYVRAAGTKDNAYIYGVPYDPFHFVTGSIPARRTDYTVDGAMPDPAWYCAYELDSVMRKSGIQILGKPLSLREIRLLNKDEKKHRQTLFSEYSPRLGDIIWWTNKKSVNLFAESMLKTLALRRSGVGAEGAGTDAVTAFWTGKGVNLKGFYMNDGCGLSRWNSITARQFTAILRVATRDPGFKSFYKSFPEYNSTIVAKGGYITRVRSYTGYATKRNGELLAFSIIANNYDCSPVDARKKLEKLVDLIGQLN
ncbi:MAG: D-alanyl-D-alanine carboxypeptidase/D-alanyl-D-alanine-endopeptidase [Bacteroidia bacterium]